MKKLLSIALTLLLLVSTIGITVSRHYCESFLIETSLMASIGDACDSDMPMDDDSCSDDHQHYSVNSPLLLVPFNFDFSPSIEWATAPVVLVINIELKNLSSSNFYADLYPPPSEPDIYTKVQSFLL